MGFAYLRSIFPTCEQSSILTNSLKFLELYNVRNSSILGIVQSNFFILGKSEAQRF